MTFLYLVLFVIAGAAVGSFLNVCADRIPSGRSIARGRSQCDVCSKELGSLDLIPVASYLWLRGRCRYCGATIPLRLPVVEALMAALFGLIWFRFGAAAPGPWTLAQAAVYVLHASLLVLVAEIDVTDRLILNKITYPWAVLTLALSPILLRGGNLGPATPGFSSFAFLSNGLLSSAAGGMAAFAVMGIIYVVSAGGMGFGDVKLAGVIGLMFGLPLAGIALMVVFISGGLAGAALLLLRIKGRKDPLPYGVFLSFGALVTLFWGSGLWEAYLRWFL
ncbi:MAG: prepilin peptidase [Chloroflexi bacterium]|nr:prepilin peptidase [Chloroflexota bacterium]